MIPKHLLDKCLAHVPPRLLLTLDHTIISSTDLTAAVRYLSIYCRSGLRMPKYLLRLRK